MKHCFQVAAAALLSLLLAGCWWSGGETRVEFGVLSVTPDDVTLRAGESAELSVVVLLQVQGSVETSSLRCRPAAEVPAGVSVEFVGCEQRDFYELRTTGDTNTFPLRVSVAGGAPGRYAIAVPLTYCFTVDEDASVEKGPSCDVRFARFTLVVPAGGAVPEGPPAETGWQALGEVLNLDARSTTGGPVLAVDDAGTPHAAFVENGRPVVRRWDGTAWRTLGEPGTGANAVGRPALAFDGDGTPVLAWSEDRPAGGGGPRQVQVRRWSGSAWVAANTGPIDAPGAVSAHDPALLRHAGRLLLAWSEQAGEADGGSRVQLRRWNGGGWSAVGSGSVAAPGEPMATALAAVDAGSAWAVAWRNALDGRVRVQAGSEVPVTPIGSFAAINTERFALLGTTSHGLLLALPPSPPAAQFSVQRWDGSAWQPFGAVQGTTGTGAFVLDVALGLQPGGGLPLLAWSEATLSRRAYQVRRWNGSDWAALGGALPPLGRTGNGGNLGVAVAAFGTVPLLATEVSQGVPDRDQAIRVQAFR